jgi:hypothetical protein
MHQDAETNTTVRQCIETKLQSVTMRAEKAEAELKSVYQANVDMDLQVIKIKAECSQLRQDNQCDRQHSYRQSVKCRMWLAAILV